MGFDIIHDIAEFKVIYSIFTGKNGPNTLNIHTILMCNINETLAERTIFAADH